MSACLYADIYGMSCMCVCMYFIVCMSKVNAHTYGHVLLKLWDNKSQKF